MRLGNRPLIFRALVVLQEAAKACHDKPMVPSAGVRLALAYLYALAGVDRGSFDGFVEAIGDAGLPDAADWQPKYIRNRDANSAIQGIVRTLGFNATVTALSALDDALRSGDWPGASQRFWADIDEQVRTGMCRPLRPYEWLVPRPIAAGASSPRSSASGTPGREPS